jgi:hypothetical protein
MPLSQPVATLTRMPSKICIGKVRVPKRVLSSSEPILNIQNPQSRSDRMIVPLKKVEFQSTAFHWYYTPSGYGISLDYRKKAFETVGLMFLLEKIASLGMD